MNVNGLDVGKWKIIPIDLKKLSDDFNTLKTKIHSLERKIPDATTLTPISQYNTDKQNLEKKMEIFIKNTKYKWFSDYNCLEYKH